jgi:serpin B
METKLQRLGRTGTELAVGLSILLGACAADKADIVPEPPGAVARSELERDLSPQVSAEDRATLAAGNRHFAFDLYSRLRGGSGNLVLSPYSISLALAMTYAGARGETATQMAAAASFTLPQERLHAAFDDLDLALTATDGEGLELRVLNQLFGQDGFVFEQPFLDTLAVDYGADLRLMDFVHAADASRQAINDWVEEATAQRIKDLLPQGSVTSSTRLVLANAIYFNGKWKSPFDSALTSAGTFHLLDGGTTPVAMMHRALMLPYAQADGYQAVELPYEGGRYAMLIIVPDAGRFNEIDASLDAARLDDIEAALTPAERLIGLPKFELEEPVSLKNILQSLGMVDAFDTTADFTGMRAEGGLYVGDVLHKAFVKVDEEGTEAAAATAVVMVGGAIPTPPIRLEIDRPFCFAIRERDTGSILFLGRVLAP